MGARVRESVRACVLLVRKKKKKLRGLKLVDGHGFTRRHSSEYKKNDLCMVDNMTAVTLHTSRDYNRPPVHSRKRAALSARRYQSPLLTQ